MSIGYSNLRKGLAVELDGEPYIVVEYKSRKMQKRAPVMQIRFRSLKTGRIIDRSFQGDDVKLIPAEVKHRSAEYIYKENDLYFFMDTETFDQFPMPSNLIETALPFLVDQATVELVFHDQHPIAVDLPITMEMKVIEAPPGHKGDTAQGGTKPIMLETGLSIQAPLFITEGEIVRVDTRTSEYLGRV